MIGAFHFLRPWWLLALIPAATLVWTILRRQSADRPWRGIVSPRLLPYLLSGESRRSRFGPVQLLGLCWLLSVLALAGPAWRREPSPFAEDTAALAIVVKVTPSMLAEDVQPNRLARSVQKIHDLLALRSGARTALIAYSGTAHVVMPETKDDGIISTFADALDPKIMPEEGDSPAAALEAADRALAGGKTSGSILWIADSGAGERAESLSAWRRNSSTPVRMLAPLLEGAELQALHKAADRIGADVVQLTPDATDVTTLAHAAKFSTAAAGFASDRWREDGYWFTPVLAAISLVFFRRGWMAATAAR